MNIIPFDFKGHSVRVVTDDNSTAWFVAKDVCETLHIDNVSQAVARLDDDEKLVSTLYISGQNRDILCINESGLYSLTLSSNKSEAKAFKKWVTSEVLPSIRKTGGYSLQPKLPANYIEALQALVESEKAKAIAIATKAEIGSRREATAMSTASHAVKKVKALEVQLDRSMNYCTVKRAEMLYHGQKFDWRLLKSACAELDIIAIDVFDQNYGTVKAYPAEAWKAAYALDII